VRVFLDTNVLVAAFASRALCAELVELILLENELIGGRNVLRELDKALRTKVRLSAADAAEIVGFFSVKRWMTHAFCEKPCLPVAREYAGMLNAWAGFPMPSDRE
jgi:hypothetical protein